MADRKQLAHQLYEAFSAGERDFFEQHLADDLVFQSPPDPELDRAGFFEKCWPGAGRGQGIDIVRTIESGDEVVVTYGSTGRTAAAAATPRSSPSMATR